MKDTIQKKKKAALKKISATKKQLKANSAANSKKHKEIME